MATLRAAVLAVVVCAGVVTAGVVLALAAASTISSFSPASGTIGATVSGTGSGFTGASKAMFNGAVGLFAVNSDTKITATVPRRPRPGRSR